MRRAGAAGCRPQRAGVHQAGVDLVACPASPAVVATGAGRRALRLEIDVGVTHLAVGSMEAGDRVVVAADAVYAAPRPRPRPPAYLGVELVHCKGVYYDWVRTLEAALAFEREHPDLAEPPGFSI